MLWLSTLILCFSSANAFLLINDSLPYCDNSKTPTLVDMEQSCFHSRDETAKSALYIGINTSCRKTYGTSSLNPTKYHVVTKKANEVHGVGWQCQISKLFTIYYKTFLRNKVIQNEWGESVKMSPVECLMIDQFKTCNNLPMVCVEDGSCSYEGERKPNYDWLKPHTGVVSSCKTFKRVIIAADKSSTLFDVVGCTTLQGHCSLKESIVTWTPNDIIDKCPYERF
jgi:hypothetical protein